MLAYTNVEHIFFSGTQDNLKCFEGHFLECNFIIDLFKKYFKAILEDLPKSLTWHESLCDGWDFFFYFAKYIKTSSRATI